MLQQPLLMRQDNGVRRARQRSSWERNGFTKESTDVSAWKAAPSESEAQSAFCSV